MLNASTVIRWVILQENAELPEARTEEGETTTDRGLRMKNSDIIRQGTYGMAIDYCILKEGMSILGGRKSVPRISSSERENGKKGTTPPS
nr:hypothetical protein [Tanacetum cinerariifolium]